jgi:hypothetical protein
MHVELRVTSRELGWPFILQVAWIVASLSVLLIGLGTCIPGEEPCSAAGNLMVQIMLCFSFPAGVLFFLSMAILGWDSIHTPATYFEVWLGAFVLGYLQWFLLVPHIFGRSLVTSLGLSPPEAREHDSSRRKQRRRRRLQQAELAPFDTKARTPVERLIDEDD